ncbi:MAG: hypothetical protein FWD47_13950 [Treponema sp.]|nr:hypothetical protein [Treponema sp.]
MKDNGKNLYTLIPLDDFKALMGIDEREDKTARFCLLTATLTIEQYCKRKFLRKKYIETSKLNGDLLIPLREYPVTEILVVFASNKEAATNKEKIIEPIFYRPMIGNGFNEEYPFELLLSTSLKPYCYTSFKVIYWAGYVVNSHPCEFTTRSFCEAKTSAKARKTAASMPPVPADLSSACMELAAWNMNRYRGKRIGMTGNIRGAGIHGEHFELSMPENVKALLEPYRRKTI